MKHRLLACFLSTVVALSSVLLCTIPAAASAAPASLPKVIYWIDEEFSVNMVKVFGPEASRAVQVHTEIDIDSKEGVFNWTQVETPNYCGYCQDNSGTTTIYGVIAQFTARHCTGAGWPYTWDSEWIGVSYTNMLQTGVNMHLMKAWVELLPGSEQDLFSVNAGDDIHASVGYAYSGYWYVSILDQTTSQGWGAYFAYSPNQNKAEWIVENNPNYPMGTFGTVYFTGCHWWDYTTQYFNLGQGAGTLYQYHISNDSGYLWPSSTDGTSFTVTKN
jgi:hypothetical protein